MKLIIKKGEEIINKHSFTNRDNDYDFGNKFRNPFNNVIPRIGENIQYTTIDNNVIDYTVTNIKHATKEGYNNTYEYTCIVEVE